MLFSIKIPLLCLLTITVFSLTQASVGGYVCPNDKKKFVEILQTSLKTDEDVLSIYHAVNGLKLLNQNVDNSKAVCDKIKKNFKVDADNLETAYAGIGAWASLKCDGKVHTDNQLKDIKSVLSNEKASIQNTRFALEILNILKVPIEAQSKIAQNIQSRLKEDDSLPSLGQALHAAFFLGNAGKFALDRVEDIVVQLDEVDGKILQWEGGLSTTSLLLTGLLRLPGAEPFTNQQTDKLANYLMSRKTVQTVKGLSALLEAAHALANSKLSPVSISVVGAARVEVDKPELKVQVSDILGEALKPAPTSGQVQSVKKMPEETDVSIKPSLTKSTATEFILNLKGLEPGQYNVAITIGPHTSTLPVRVLGPISVKSLEIGLGDTDGTSVPKLVALKHPEKLTEKLQGDSSQQLVVKFSITRDVHQAFLRLYTGNKEIIFVAEKDSSKMYKVEVNLANELAKSGLYDIELILGDASVINPIRWLLGSIEVNLGAADAKEATQKVTKGPKPEIKHLFRVADKRPPETVSLFFTGLTAAPLLVLFVLWAKIGVNVGNFSFTAVPFHLGFAGILGLFTLFWLKLDMFTTCAWLIPIGGFTFLTGHKLLSQIANARAKKSEKSEK